MATNNNSIKVVMVGDGGVGKSTWVKRVRVGIWEPKYVATLGVEVHPIHLDCGVTFNVWDTAGQEKFGGLRDGYYIQAKCAIVWCDLGSKATLRNCAQWIKDLNRVCGDIPIVMVGNKCDLLDRKVKQHHINLFLNSYWGSKVSMYLEMSVKNQVGLLNPLEILSALVEE